MTDTRVKECWLKRVLRATGMPQISLQKPRMCLLINRHPIRLLHSFHVSYLQGNPGIVKMMSKKKNLFSLRDFWGRKKNPFYNAFFQFKSRLFG